MLVVDRPACPDCAWCVVVVAGCVSEARRTPAFPQVTYGCRPFKHDTKVCTKYRLEIQTWHPPTPPDRVAPSHFPRDPVILVCGCGPLPVALVWSISGPLTPLPVPVEGFLAQGARGKMKTYITPARNDTEIPNGVPPLSLHLSPNRRPSNDQVSGSDAAHLLVSPSDIRCAIPPPP